MKRAFAIAFAALMIASMVLTPFGGAVATASAQQIGPSGMVALGPEQVREDLPSGTTAPLRASDLEGAAYASDHASTLEVVVTTPDRAGQYLESGSIISDNDNIAIVLRDQSVHQGRDVAIDVTVLEEAVGYTPKLAYGTHSSGDVWRSEIVIEDTIARWEVPHFSANSVTFESDISLTASPASNGDTLGYQLASDEGVSDARLTLSGKTTTESRSIDKTGLKSASSIPVEVRGTEDTVMNLTVSPNTVTKTKTWDGSYSPSSGSTTFLSGSTVGGNVEPSSGTVQFNTNTENWVQVDTWDTEINSGGFGSKGRSYTVPTEGRYRLRMDYESWIDGRCFPATKVQADKKTPDTSGSWETIKSDRDGDGCGASIDSYGTDTIWTGTAQPGDVIGGRVGSRDRVQVKLKVRVERLSGKSTVTFNGNSRTFYGSNSWNFNPSKGQSLTYSVDSTTGISGADWSVSVDERHAPEDVTVDVASTTGTELTTTGRLSSSRSTVANTPVGDTTLEITNSNGVGTVDVSADWMERTKTIDPTMEINTDAGSQTISYDGTLTDGTTVDLSDDVDESRIGGNVHLNVSVSESARGVPGQVGLEYGHTAPVSQSVDYVSETWSERYTLSKTYDRDRSDVALRIPWASDQVGYIRDYNVTVNGQAVSSNSAIEDGELVVSVGAISAGDNVTISANGSKVQSLDGAIQVVEPSVPGDELSTEIKITELNPDGQFGLRVDGSELGDQLHYASETSWTGAPAYTSHTVDGIQILHADDASVGSTMTVETAPVSVMPDTGAIETLVEDAAKPTLSLRTGDTVGSSRVDIEYMDATSGDRYVLWSETEDTEIDADRGQSTVAFTTDGDAETYSIIQRDGAASTAGPGIAGPVDTRDGPPLLLFLGAVGAIIGGTVLARRRFGIKRRTLAIAAVPAVAVATQALTPLSPLTAPLKMGSQLIEMALQGIFQSNILLVVAVGALLIGLWQLDERTSGSVPWYIRAIIVGLSIVWALETLSPGVILGGLRAGFDSMGPLIVIVLVGGGAYLIREWIQARRAPDTVVQFSAGNEEN